MLMFYTVFNAILDTIESNGQCKSKMNLIRHDVFKLNVLISKAI